MAKHFRYGGSNAFRWLNCAGSPARLAGIPAKPSSVYAEEGTLAHDFAAWCLREGERSAAEIVGATLDGAVGAKPCTEDMARSIQVYLDAVWAEFDRTPDAMIFVEQFFEMESAAGPGEVGGSSDCVIYHPSLGRLVGFDYKHGVQPVDAEDNDQIKFYLTGSAFLNEWRLAEVVGVIVQPNDRMLEAGSTGVKEWTFDTVDLLEFKEQIETAIAATKAPGAPLKAGGWCDKTWCDARVDCPAYQALKLAGTGFEGVDITQPVEMPEPSELTPERLAAIVAGWSGLQKIFAACQEYLEAQVMSGVEVPGWKVVEKIGRAKWVADEAEVAAELDMVFGIDEDLIRPRKLETITNVEKLMKGAGATKDQIDNMKLKYTIKDSNGLTIAPDTDRRPAVNLAERAFGDVQIEAAQGS